MTLHQLFNFLLREEKRSLWLFVFFSIILHVAVFFIFKSETRYSKMHLIAPPSVMLLPSSSTKEMSDVSGWTDLLDPRQFAFPSKTLPSSFSKKPEFDQILPTLELPALNIPVSEIPHSLSSTLEDLPTRAAKSITSSQASPMPITVETPPALSKTDFLFQGALSKRKIIKKEPFPLVSPSLTLLKPTVLRLAADSQGLTSYALVDESCGDSEVDLIAVQALKNWRFEPSTSKDKLQWGKITVFWDVQTVSAEAEDAAP